jgi:glycerate-2-kinase
MRDEARAIWTAGVRAVDAESLVRGAVGARGAQLRLGEARIPLAGLGRVVVVGAGKAGAAMASGLEAALGPRFLREHDVRGWVNVPGNTVRPLRAVVLHPARRTADNEPTPEGVKGSRRMLELIAPLGPKDLVVCLVSGGGSALWPLPAGAVTLADKRRITELLHRSGADIGEMNSVRKHLSQVKGGGLVRATRARIVSLLVSDVVGDPLDVIASGPTAPDPSTYTDALDVLRRHDLLRTAPPRVVAHLRAGERGEHPETLSRPSPRVHHEILGNNRVALDAAARTARTLGFRVLDLGPFVEGESREVGTVLAGIARGVRETPPPGRGPVCVLSGGETTVRLGSRPGKGGRNQELVLAALVHLDGKLEGITVLSGGTDGEDGPTDAAGAIADARLAARARRRGLDPVRALEAHDAYPFFEAAGGLLRSGPTGTNVMDLRVVLVTPRDRPGRRHARGRASRSTR